MYYLSTQVDDQTRFRDRILANIFTPNRINRIKRKIARRVDHDLVDDILQEALCGFLKNMDVTRPFRQICKYLWVCVDFEIRKTYIGHLFENEKSLIAPEQYTPQNVLLVQTHRPMPVEIMDQSNRQPDALLSNRWGEPVDEWEPKNLTVELSNVLDVILKCARESDTKVWAIKLAARELNLAERTIYNLLSKIQTRERNVA